MTTAIVGIAVLIVFTLIGVASFLLEKKEQSEEQQDEDVFHHSLEDAQKVVNALV